MGVRTIGVASVFLLYGHFTDKKVTENDQIRRLGETFLGIVMIAQVYGLIESPEDKNAFLSHIPCSVVALYIYAIILGAAGLCYLPGIFVHDVTQVLVFLYTLVTLLIDTDFNYWSKKRGLDFWNQFRLLSDSLLIVLGFIMLLSHTRKQVYAKD